MLPDVSLGLEFEREFVLEGEFENELEIDGGVIDIKYGGPGFSNLGFGAILFEIAKVDASVATFVAVHNAIGMNVVATLGDEDQKQRMLTDSIGFRKIHCFGLTEPENGSDASNLRTTATKTEGGWILNGQKRWIGNATFADYIHVWARNPAEDDKVQCFVVTKGSEGLKTSKIERKYSLRMV